MIHLQHFSYCHSARSNGKCNFIHIAKNVLLFKEIKIFIFIVFCLEKLQNIVKFSTILKLFAYLLVI